MNKGYRDLRVWHLAMTLAEPVYQATKSFPQDERFGLTSQMRRSAVSVPSNIAAGRGRGTDAELTRFCGMARMLNALRSSLAPNSARTTPPTTDDR
jgi:hypothetical protein